MATENKITIFIIDDSFNNEEKVVKIMRAAGYAAHTTRVEDDEDLIDALRKTIPDILLYGAGMELISLEQTITCLKENVQQPIPVIAINRKGHEETDAVKAMRAGAKDLSSYDNPSHLELVIKREMQAHDSIKKLAMLEIANKETERRCEALLDSSRDAIAYIHEGMHVYSNQSYMELFGFTESEELEGMPILDMVGMDDRNTFKDFLRKNCSGGTCSSEKLELSLRNPDGTEFSGAMEFSPASVDGEPCIQLIIRNQVDNKELEKQLALMGQKDTTTDLYNRQYFIDSLNQVVTDAKQKKQRAAVLMLHLDNYNDIRQSSGVAISDQYLN